MVYVKNHPVAPELILWRDARIDRSTGTGAGAEKAMRDVSAVSHVLGVQPACLPENALALYCEAYRETHGKSLRPSTVGSYRGSLASWRNYLAVGFMSLQRQPISSVTRSKNAPDTLHPHLEKWRRKMQMAKRSEETIADYLNRVIGMMELAGKADPLDLDEDDVEIFITGRMEMRRAQGKEMAASTQNGYLAAVRGCFKANKRAKSDPTLDIPRLTRHSVPTPAASETQVVSLMDAGVRDMESPDAETRATGRTMWMATAMMSGMGFRISTAARVITDDMEFDGERHWITPQFLKGRLGQEKARHVVPGHIVEELSLNWQSGESVMPLDWDRTKAAARWQAWAESHGVSGVRCHMLRAYFINAMYHRTGDLFGVSMAADHRDIKTTVGYMQRATRKETLESLQDFGTALPVRSLPAQRTAGNVRVLRSVSRELTTA